MLQLNFASVISVTLLVMTSAAYAQSSCNLKVQEEIVDSAVLACTSGQGNPPCGKTLNVTAKEGYQACNISYNTAGSNRTFSVSVAATDRYINDPEKPSRFRTFRVTSSAKGDTIGHGSNVAVNDLRFKSVPAKASNKDRFECGCRLDP